MSPQRWTLFVLAWFLPVTTTQAEVGEPADRLFQSHDVVEVRLVAPIAKIISKRRAKKQFEGRLQYAAEDGSDIELDVEIRARGRFRLQKRICPFPPLRLNFKKSQTKGSLFAGQDKIKLVTHCRNGSERYEQAVLREYIAYRILNQLTDISFRVRLLKITYEDTDTRKPQMVTYGFVVEHKDRMAKRTGLTTLQIARIRVSGLQPQFANLVSVFHFLIGNTDFSPIKGSKEECCHNHVLLGRDGELAYSVPYDFDQAGLVDAPHARANPRFKLSSVRQRLYRGRCSNNRFLDETLEKYQQQRAAIMQLPSIPLDLSDATRESLTTFLTQFYAIIDSPDQVDQLVVKKCI